MYDNLSDAMNALQVACHFHGWGWRMEETDTIRVAVFRMSDPGAIMSGKPLVIAFVRDDTTLLAAVNRIMRLIVAFENRNGGDENE